MSTSCLDLLGLITHLLDAVYQQHNRVLQL